MIQKMNTSSAATAMQWPECVRPGAVLQQAKPNQHTADVRPDENLPIVPSPSVLDSQEFAESKASAAVNDMALHRPSPKQTLTSYEWLMQRFASHAVPGVFPPGPNDLISDEAEIAFSKALSLRPELLRHSGRMHTLDNLSALPDNAVTDSVTVTAGRIASTGLTATDGCQPRPLENLELERSQRDATVTVTTEPQGASTSDSRPRKRRRAVQHCQPECDVAAGASGPGTPGPAGRLLFAPVAAAAAEVGLPKAVVQRWIADEQVAFIRPQPNNSHRLVDMQDLRRYLEHKRHTNTTVAKSKTRVLVYALVQPRPKSSDDRDGHPPAENMADVVTPESSDSEAEVDVDNAEGVHRRVVDQVRAVADAMNLVHGKYMYNGDIADADDWAHRPCFDLMVDKIVAREIHTVVAASPAHLARGSAFRMLHRLCQRNGVEIKCVRHFQDPGPDVEMNSNL